MNDCIFCKIANKEIPKEFDYEDENVMVFADIHPIAPIHLLVVSKKHIPDFLNVEDSTLFSNICTVVQKMAEKNGLQDKGYRIVVNGGGAQVVDHLHFHLTGPMGKAAKM